MKSLPSERLDPRVRNVWRISDAIGVSLVMLPLTLAFGAPYLLAATESLRRALGVATLACLIAWAALLVVVVAVLPPIRYARWRYELTDDYLDVAKGIVWRTRHTVPFIRVQDTDTRQGPIMRAFGLASVTVSTASDSHEIPGLTFEVAERMRDRAAELARIAREDV